MIYQKRSDNMDSIYNRYALSLFSIAKEENQVEKYKNTIKMIKQVMLENKDLVHLLSSYFILQEEKEMVLDNIFPQVDEYILNFIKIIVKNKRMMEIIGIFNEFNKMCNDYLKIKEGTIYSTEELSSSEIESIEQKLSKVISTKVELINKIDEKLIGGIKVVIEDQVFDGSIKNKLETLKSALISGGK